MNQSVDTFPYDR
uniref:Uncharacterized protein n=1 Tax=Amphimedon queenslandica TaxID=400682 RepID=A0A1X7V4K1_AMPQE